MTKIIIHRKDFIIMKIQIINNYNDNDTTLLISE